MQIVGKFPTAVRQTGHATHGERVCPLLTEGIQARRLFQILGFALRARRDQAKCAGSLKVCPDDGRRIKPGGAGPFKDLDCDRELIGTHAGDGDLKFGKRRAGRKRTGNSAGTQHSATVRIEIGHG